MICLHYNHQLFNQVHSVVFLNALSSFGNPNDGLGPSVVRPLEKSDLYETSRVMLTVDINNRDSSESRDSSDSCDIRNVMYIYDSNCSSDSS